MSTLSSIALTAPELTLSIGAIALLLWSAWGGDRAARAISIVAVAVLTGAAFLLLGVLTPVDMRYYLAALPAVAIAAAAGASDGLARGGATRAVSVAMLLWSAWLGVSTWWTTLG